REDRRARHKRLLLLPGRPPPLSRPDLRAAARPGRRQGPPAAGVPPRHALRPQVRRVVRRRRPARRGGPRPVRGPAGRHPVAGERGSTRHRAAPPVPAAASGAHLPGPGDGARPGLRPRRGQDRPRRLVLGRPGWPARAGRRPGQPRDRAMARSDAVNDQLTSEAYARAALTYLAEPADRWLRQLLRVHGAAATLDAIKSGRLLSTTAPVSDPADLAATGPARPRDRAREAVKAAMERWRTRLPELPSPEQVLAFGQSGIRLVCPGNPEWPGQLADLGDDQPYALWLRGSADLRFNCLRAVAIVGSRAATAYGSYIAAEFAASVAARGLAVVSGGAFGIDAAAHRGALGADGVTVAVLACGVDMPYPAAHAELFDAIAAQGTLVSEWPPGRPVSRLRFLVRNRVIAALAPGTLVV